MMDKIKLPKFKPESDLKFSQVVKKLRYCRNVSPSEISLHELSKVLYAIQGVSGGSFWVKARTIPSAGATYPLDVYVEPYCREVKKGLYRYSSTSERISELNPEEARENNISRIYIHAVFARTTRRYGSRGEHYVLMEVGHAIQNALLEATLLNLGFSYSLNLDDLSRSLKEGREPLVILELGSYTGKPSMSYEVSSLRDEAIKLKISALHELTLEEVILKRRSIRKYSSPTLSLEELSYVLYYSSGRVWAEDRPYAPPQNTYHLDIYVVVGGIEGLTPGIYLYNDKENSLVLVREGDHRRELYKACLGQDWILEAPASIVLASKPGDERWYLDVETGMIGQNVYLAATSIGLGTVAVGAFYDDEVAQVLRVDKVPLYVMPLGRLG